MSVSAHRIKKIEMTGCRFNLYYDDAVAKWLGDNTDFFNKLDSDTCGITEVSVNDLKIMLKEVSIDNELRKSIEDDIAWAEKKDDDYVMYYCF